MSTASTLKPVIKTADLAKALGLDRSTICRWASVDQRWRACVVKRTRRSTYWSRAALISAGILMPDPAAAPTPGLSTTFTVQGIQ